jgi:hypothetical protein
LHEIEVAAMQAENLSNGKLNVCCGASERWSFSAQRNNLFPELKDSSAHLSSLSRKKVRVDISIELLCKELQARLYLLRTLDKKTCFRGSLMNRWSTKLNTVPQAIH